MTDLNDYLARYGDNLTPTELAKLLRAKRNTLAIWRCQGKGPAFVKAGRMVLYPKPNVQEWLIAQTRTHTI